MSDELKKCPFCGSEAKVELRDIQTGVECTNRRCITNTFVQPTYDQWNTRPLEDALQARIDKLESENDLLSGRATVDLLKPFVEQIKLEDEPMDTIHAGIKILLAKIADLESEVKALRLIAGSHSMSELRRNRIMAGWRRGDTLKNEVKHE